MGCHLRGRTELDTTSDLAAAATSYEEKEMADHSSILTERIPWTEEPGGCHLCTESDTTEVN